MEHGEVGSVHVLWSTKNLPVDSFEYFEVPYPPPPLSVPVTRILKRKRESKSAKEKNKWRIILDTEYWSQIKIKIKISKKNHQVKLFWNSGFVGYRSLCQKFRGRDPSGKRTRSPWIYKLMRNLWQSNNKVSKILSRTYFEFRIKGLFIIQPRLH